MKIRLFIAILLITGILCRQAAASPFFETQRMEDTYSLLPAITKLRIDASSHEKELHIPLDNNNALSGQIIAVCFNPEKQISNIGFKLFDKKEIQDQFEDVYYFIENSLLSFALLAENKLVWEEAHSRKINLSCDFQAIPFSSLFGDFSFSLDLQEGFFLCNWLFLNGENFSLRFPADISLIKGMNKKELELDFHRKLTAFEKPQTKTPQTYNADYILPTGLYLQQGKKLETDNFRSDIFLTKEQNIGFQPVYSPGYPVESFSNLFICNLNVPLEMNITQMVYGNKKITHSLALNRALACLSLNREIYFGLQDNPDIPDTVKASVIYYNPYYKYIHLLVAEAGKKSLFDHTNAVINATLYAYIPYTEFNINQNKSK